MAKQPACRLVAFATKRTAKACLFVRRGAARRAVDAD